jgi:hypothetical protein
VIVNLDLVLAPYQSKKTAIQKLKLSAVPDDKPVRPTGRRLSQSVEPAKLVGPMLARFMSTDRAFLRARRQKQTTRWRRR